MQHMIQQDGVTLKFLVGHKNQPRSRSSDRRREVVHSLGGLTGSPSSSTTWLLLHEDDVELQSHSCWSSEPSRSIYHVVVEGLGGGLWGHHHSEGGSPPSARMACRTWEACLSKAIATTTSIVVTRCESLVPLMELE